MLDVSYEDEYTVDEPSNDVDDDDEKSVFDVSYEEDENIVDDLSYDG